MKSVSEKVAEEIKTHFTFDNFFP